MREKLKFKKLLNEFRSLEYELEYNSDILNEAGESFRALHDKWCEENNIDLSALASGGPSKTAAKQTQPKDDGSRVETKKATSKHRDVFKSIAKKIHPDKIPEEDPRKDEFQEAFSKASSAMNEEEWGGLFDVIDRYDIEISDYDEAILSLEEDIGRLKNKLQGQKSTYSWILQNCNGDQSCIDMVMHAYMRQVFGWAPSE